MSAALGQYFRELSESNSVCDGSQRTILIVSDNARIASKLCMPRPERELRRWKSAESSIPLRRTSRWESSQSEFDFSPRTVSPRIAGHQKRRDSSPGKPAILKSRIPLPESCNRLPKDRKDCRWANAESCREYLPEVSVPKSLRSLPY
jgi:hypothetical protein